jgi:hypothetical protein
MHLMFRSVFVTWFLSIRIGLGLAERVVMREWAPLSTPAIQCVIRKDSTGTKICKQLTASPLKLSIKEKQTVGPLLFVCSHHWSISNPFKRKESILSRLLTPPRKFDHTKMQLQLGERRLKVPEFVFVLLALWMLDHVSGKREVRFDCRDG